ncbi:GNAT family N-acetyltransferase [Kitasatospora cineracea]|uniref:Ornithine-acyl[acyl carrier protein] N-acyltransferase n=1 Tax=Kitasatospora cineracea TaxID=88074 RepID=A0A8G1X798_9ACTN|nr:GNAT family N-acyltransferase [Kitasatospora cineracea]ROR33937.1 ornithine-acyl[acyl carrier protein] N-acyltransferase [Kitasatospora cineracea]
MTTAPARPGQLPATAPAAARLAPSRLPEPRQPSYQLVFARTAEDVRAAQRLRHQVFADEMGAVLDSPLPGLDADPFDEFCDHLLVREQPTGEVVGTYRLLRPEQARRAGRLYSDTEFDLARLGGLRDGMVEVGRSCITAAHRGNGAVINLMWGGIARYMTATGNAWLAGCCSIPLADGGATAAGVWDTVSAKHLAPQQYRVAPLRPWSAEGVARAGRTPVPALLRGYLRLGAWVCGEPAYDPDFNVADLYVLLSLERTDPRYLRHFLAAAADLPLSAITGGDTRPAADPVAANSLADEGASRGTATAA